MGRGHQGRKHQGGLTVTCPGAVLDGIDPIDVRRAERAKATQVMTFKAAAEAYNALHEPKWRNAKHRKQFLASLACYAYPVLGDLTVSAIDGAKSSHSRLVTVQH